MTLVELELYSALSSEFANCLNINDWMSNEGFCVRKEDVSQLQSDSSQRRGSCHLYGSAA
jgi:hypothetical protein